MENDVSWIKRLFSGPAAKEHYSPSTFPVSELAAPTKKVGRQPLLPRFHGSATDELRGMRGGPAERVRMRLRDAFTPSQPVSDTRNFAGRSDVLNTLIRSIEDQRMHVVLYGERGIGKTSLLRVMTQLAEDAQYLVRYVSCGEETDFASLTQTITASIPLLYHAGYEPGDTEIEEGGSLADLLPPGQVGANQLCDVLSRLSGTRLLIVLDEFDRSPRGTFRRSIAELIKNLSDRSIRVQFVISGVASNLNELIEHIPSIRRNVMGLRVPPMTNAEARELIAIGEEASGLPFDERAADLVAMIANGSPYLVSLIGQHAALRAIDRHAASVEASDVAEAVRIAVEEIEQRISERTVRTVDRMFAKRTGVDLGTLACMAMSNGGRLETRGNGTKTDSIRECARIVEEVALPASLVTPIGEPDEGVYEFAEEAAPAYIWMRLSQDQFQHQDSHDSPPIMMLG